MRVPGALPPFFSSILCPVDFSRPSRLALRHAAALAARTGGALHVLFVNDPLLVAAAAAAGTPDSISHAGGQELRRLIRSTLTPRAASAVLTCSTATGTPWREILSAAARGHHDAIVLGTKGLNGAKRLLLGSTTSAVLRRVKIPVLAVPPGARTLRTRSGRPWPGRRIMAAIDLDRDTGRHVAAAADVARRLRVSLTLVHVVRATAAPPWFRHDVDAALDARVEQAAALLEAAARSQTDVGIDVAVRCGDPAREIATIAREVRPGVLVMVLETGRGLLGDAAGSLSYELLCRGVGPVLALPSSPGSARRRG
jgi:nucleotide-binding universal stress UspA family protein